MLGLFVWCHYRCVQLNILLLASGSSCAPGPYGAGIFDPRAWGNEDSTNTVVLEFTRVVLAIGVFAIGVELPKAYMRRHWKSLFFLLAPVMTWVRSLLFYFFCLTYLSRVGSSLPVSFTP